MKIGITYTGDDVRQQWYNDYIQAGNPDITIVTLRSETGNPDEALQCDGIVLSGAVMDMHPKFYGADENYPNAPKAFEVDKDEFEFAVFEKVKDKLPVLGICRGLQLVNVAMGGTLITDLDNLNPTHRAPNSLIEDKEHTVVVKDNTLLQQATHSGTYKVTSAHHQAIDVLGKDLVPNSFSADDNIIEGIEWEDKIGKPFMLCVQWHPERMFRIGEGENPLAKNLRDTFIKEVEKHH